MVARNKKPPADPDAVELIPKGITQLLLQPGIFRGLILVLLLSMHPVGRQVLGTFGFEFPDQRKLTVATEEASGLKSSVTQIAKVVEDMQKDLTSIKANNAILNSKFDRLDQAFTGFQVDFNKYRKPQEPQSQP